MMRRFTDSVSIRRATNGYIVSVGYSERADDGDTPTGFTPYHTEETICETVEAAAPIIEAALNS